MRRNLKLMSAVLSCCAAFAGVALAAARPAAVTGGVSAVGDTSAELHGSVNPNGSSTTYYFQWGLTSSYGASGPVRSAGNGSKGFSVEERADHLDPGTVYHYRVVATDGAGTTFGADRTFKTTGHPSAAAATGPVTQLSSSGATLTGTVSPNGEKTTWYFEWGSLSSLSQETAPQTISATAGPQAVTWSLQGLLNAGTIYQYRLVASHPNSPKTYGPTVIFMTYPSVRPYATVTASTRPRNRVLFPYTFTTTGTVSGGSSTPAQFACIGEVTLRFYDGRRQVRFETAPVQSNCAYSAQTVFDRLPGGAHAPVRLKVVVHFVSTPYLARSRAPISYVTII